MASACGAAAWSIGTDMIEMIESLELWQILTVLAFLSAIANAEGRKGGDG